MRIVVGARFVRTALGDCFCPFHHQRATDGSIFFFVCTSFSGRSGIDGILTLRIVRAAVKYAEPSSSLAHKSFTASWAQNPGGVLFFKCFVALYIFAFRIVVTSNKFPIFPFTLTQHPRCALRTLLACFFGSFYGNPFHSACA